MNQQFAPSDATIAAQGWESLGTYTAASGTLNVSLSDNADGVVVANAVTIVQTQAPSTTPSMVDNSDGAFSESGSGWQGYSDSSSVDGGFRYCAAGTGENTAAMDFANVNPSTQYQVYATWSAAGNRATDAPYTVSDGGTTLATVDMNQQFAPSDLTVSGQGWESLGTFTAASGTLNVGLSDNADGIVDADAVMILPVQPPTIAPSMVDNSDGAFSESGTGWQGYSDSSSVNGGFRYCTAGTGENTATWTFANVSPTAQYQIYATWSAAGLPAHLVLTGNGVAVINNDQVDIWDWDNLDNDSCADCCPDCCSPSTNWVLVPRKPQEQGTMDYDESSNTFTQTVDGTQYIFDGPDPDDDAWDSPNDFGLLSESIDPYGNQTDYYYQRRQRFRQLPACEPDLDGRPRR